MNLVVNNLGKRYHYQYVVRNINLVINSGDIAGIAGRNGSGKSTTMQMLAGYLTPSEGSIRYSIGSENIAREKIYQHLTYTAPYIDLPQKVTIRELYDHYTIFKKVEVSSFQEFHDFCDLKNTHEKYIAHFSNGMKQKIALALAVITRCELILLDEPTSYLDTFAKEWFMEGIKHFGKNKTIIIASNDSFDFGLCNQIYEIK